MREKIYLKCGHTDMRRGIDGLSGVVIEELGLKVCDESAMFIFCGRNLLFRRGQNLIFRWIFI